MRPVLLDTNTYAAFNRKDPPIIEIIQLAETIAMSSIVIGELLSGFAYGSREKKNREALQSFLDSRRVKMLNVTPDTAAFYSHIYCALRKKGKPIPSHDLWIAAQVLEHGCLLCSYDKHFESVDGLIFGATPAELMI
mgnify:FL=1